MTMSKWNYKNRLIQHSRQKEQKEQKEQPIDDNPNDDDDNSDSTDHHEEDEHITISLQVFHLSKKKNKRKNITLLYFDMYVKYINIGVGGKKEKKKNEEDNEKEVIFSLSERLMMAKEENMALKIRLEDNVRSIQELQKTLEKKQEWIMDLMEKLNEKAPNDTPTIIKPPPPKYKPLTKSSSLPNPDSPIHYNGNMFRIKKRTKYI
ncbi:hypothetical protein RFI_28283 [Reticulomyxa filosa]|uniref:Uncharacterized protein n=1 Tax=Reticulomyxa filosa TaxID=46433 RepID=X6M6K8_RETFI|nr:hypothetical protein RFI_28283 [Reticulomyxa filosa]|eukprot:ETO09097.1 hypothetical protein RFI_28283 [Reticulomyxa filosa]